MIVLVPLFVSLVAVIVAVPGATAVTNPADDTVATAVLFEPHVTSRSVTTVPTLSVTVGVSETVCVTSSALLVGATVTLPTGIFVTVTNDVPLLPSLVAVIVAVPSATPVTSPFAFTVATVGSLEPHVTTRPVSTPPTESFVTAVNWVVPVMRTPALGGVTATVLTGTSDTVIVLVPLCVSLVAVIVAVPGATAVTTPAADTVATPVLFEPHVTTRSVTTLPAVSLTVGVRAKVCVTSIALVAGATVTLPTGIFVTVIADVPLLPSLVAVIVTVPAATPVTRPVELTVATVGSLVPHVTTRPVSNPPIESLVVAANCVVAVTRMPALGGDTTTLLTGTSDTLIVLVPLFVSLVAVIVAVPGATAVTNPVDDTVATPVLFEPHVTTRSVTTVPTLSVTVGVRETVCVTSSALLVGATVTLPTGIFVTVTNDVPLLPSLVAVIVAVPSATPVTSPFTFTVAIVGSLEPQVTVRPVSTPPTESFVVAVNWAVAVMRTLAVGGATTTVLTGTSDTVIVLVPLFVSLVAVIVAVPGATAVTTPAADTVATAVLFEPHVTTRSVTVVPTLSFTVGVRPKVCVTSIALVAGATVTLPTGIFVTVIVDVPLLPSLVAVIVAVPAATPVTRPVELTVATVGSLVPHVTTRPVSNLADRISRRRNQLRRGRDTNARARR